MRSRSSASARSHSARGGGAVAGDRLERLRVGPRVGDRAVAGDAAGEPMAVGGGHRLEALLDALVHEAEPLLEAQHLLADDLEAEVTGLDDAGVDRPDRDLVHAVAFDADERVFLLRRVATSASASKSRRSGKRSIGQLACQTHGRWSSASDAMPTRSNAARCIRFAAGKTTARSGYVESPVGSVCSSSMRPSRVLQHDVDRVAAIAVAIVARPQRDELRALLPRDAARGQEPDRVDRAAPRRHGRGQRGGGESEAGEVHVACARGRVL